MQESVYVDICSVLMGEQEDEERAVELANLLDRMSAIFVAKVGVKTESKLDHRVCYGMAAAMRGRIFWELVGAEALMQGLPF